MKRNLIFFLFVCFVFILLTLIWTYPLILKLSSSIFADGKWLFDTLVAIYGIWLNKMAWLGSAARNFNNLIGYPFGVDLSCINREPALEAPLLLLSLWKNEIFAFNIIILSSFFLSAVTMYFLAFYITRNRIASFLSAIIYAFCPYHCLQAFSHISLAVIQWLPLYVLCLFKFGEKVSYTRTILCAGVFLLVALSNYYYAYVMFIFTLIFFLFNLYKKFRYSVYEGFSFIGKFLLMGLIILVVLMPLNYKAIVAVWRGPADSHGELEIPRYAPPLQDLFRYSANITDYIRPSEYHPVFGKVNFWFIKPYKDASRYWSEKTVFLGYVPMIFSFYFIFNWFRRKRKLLKEVNIYILFFSTIAAFVISLSPKLGSIPMPSFFLYKIFPMFRSYARFGILVILGTAVFAGLGYLEMLERYQRKALFTLMVVGLVLFEFMVIPPFRNVDYSKNPPEYEWIRNLPNGTAIAEYPLLSEIDSDHYKYLFYQRAHKHPLFNGGRRGSEGDAIRCEIKDISEIRSARILNYLGIQYIILHKDRYNERDLVKIDKNKGLEKTIEFENSVIYKIAAVPLTIEMFIWKNFYNSETWSDGNNWRWADNNATIWLANTKKDPVKARIAFKAISFAHEREMQVYLNNELIYKTNFAPLPDLSKKSLEETRKVKFDLLLPPGSNILRFYSSQGGLVIDDIMHNGDTRRVCFSFSNIEIKSAEVQEVEIN